MLRTIPVRCNHSTMPFKSHLQRPCTHLPAAQTALRWACFLPRTCQKWQMGSSLGKIHIPQLMSRWDHTQCDLSPWKVASMEALVPNTPPQPAPSLQSFQKAPATPLQSMRVLPLRPLGSGWALDTSPSKHSMTQQKVQLHRVKLRSFFLPCLSLLPISAAEMSQMVTTGSLQELKN